MEDAIVTEKDLCKQIASNLTKETLTAKDKVDQELVAKGKSLMLQNLATCRNVWQSFEKFIMKQVLTKGKTVDTCIAGLFRKVDD
jgi:hypothetical protein